MKKKEIDSPENVTIDSFRPKRAFVPVSYREIDLHRETESGKSDSVQKLYQDFVLGRLDPSQIGGNVYYDSDDAVEVDPFNHFGVTFEETTQVAESGAAAKQTIEKEMKKKKEADQKRLADEQQKKLEAELRMKIEKEMKEASKDK